MQCRVTVCVLCGSWSVCRSERIYVRGALCYFVTNKTGNPTPELYIIPAGGPSSTDGVAALAFFKALPFSRAFFVRPFLRPLSLFASHGLVFNSKFLKRKFLLVSPFLRACSPPTAWCREREPSHPPRTRP